MRRYFVAILFCFIFTGSALAGWKKPIEVLSGTWGDKERQFGLKIEYIKVDLPVFVVNRKGEIIVGDVINKRIKVYDSAGKLIKIFGPQLDTSPSYWPTKKMGTYNNCIFVEWGKRYQSYNYNGKVESQFKLKGTRFERILFDGNIILFDLTEKSYKKYSPTGQLLETHKERPLELGKVKERSSGSKRYKVTIKYPDMTYTIKRDRMDEQGFQRDTCLNLYLIGRITNSKDIYIDAEWEENTVSERPIPHYIVTRYDLCDNSQERLHIPANKSFFRKTATGVIRDDSILQQYGKPIVAHNGDVYCWKRTAKKYTILKWTWQGDPEAPQSLKVSTSDGKIVLAWQTPTQDAGTVKAYELYRSPDVCGPFNKIDKVKKGVMQYTDKKVNEGETYYYQVCAERGSGYSGYSNKAVGSIKN